MSQSGKIQQKHSDDRMRLDKWLWVARFFKTRQLAIEAINGGKVHVNGQRTKPGKEITPGTELSITKEPYAWEITITALHGQRRPARRPRSFTKRPQKVWQDARKNSPAGAKSVKWAFLPTADQTSGSDG